eukprot:TRINITY_DN13919_c0_g1_i1.p2 TRINITY_DN13919_c0_g1~~TRINITY_DN13919_c0_g1_i1.p2  ORF type:complete len:150 (+),score=8.93 TRINITY_DN13919_c0_g1_i1:46-495(+)
MGVSNRYFASDDYLTNEDLGILHGELSSNTTLVEISLSEHCSEFLSAHLLKALVANNKANKEQAEASRQLEITNEERIAELTRTVAEKSEQVARLEKANEGLWQQLSVSERTGAPWGDIPHNELKLGPPIGSGTFGKCTRHTGTVKRLQ